MDCNPNWLKDEAKIRGLNGHVYTGADVNFGARILYAEASGDLDERIAVASVEINRTNTHGFGGSTFWGTRLGYQAFYDNTKAFARTDIASGAYLTLGQLDCDSLKNAIEVLTNAIEFGAPYDYLYFRAGTAGYGDVHESAVLEDSSTPQEYSPTPQETNNISNGGGVGVMAVHGIRRSLGSLLIVILAEFAPAYSGQELSLTSHFNGVRFTESVETETPKPQAVGWYCSAQRAYVVGCRSLVRTDDGGRTWKGLTPPPDRKKEFGELYDLRFISEQRGWLFTAWGLWQTESGGDTWNPLVAGGRLPVFADAVHGWMRVDAFLPAPTVAYYRTSDSGVSWQSCGTATPVGSTIVPTRVSFLSPTSAWAIAVADRRPGYRYEVQFSKNGGCDWVSVWQPPADFDDDLRAIFFTDAMIGWLGGAGTIYHTNDGGRHWQELFLIEGVLIRSLYFADRDHGWLLADAFGRPGGIFATVDGGKSWKRVSRAALVAARKGSARDAIPLAWNVGRLAEMLSIGRN